MSGHSKWSTIKHKKAINDAKKGKAFSKLSSQITQAARLGGGDTEMNPTLRLYVDKAKSTGFPIDRIERAIAKGTGEGLEGVTYEESTYEGFGPAGIQLVIDTLTDNKNRTVSDIRQTFEEIGGRMGDSGSVSWNFETKGLIVVKAGHMKKSEKYGEADEFVPEDAEEVMMNIMDIDGVVDIQDTDLEEDIKGLEIYTKYNDFAKVRDAVMHMGYVLDESMIIKEAKTLKTLSDHDLEKAQNAIERFEEMDDVQNVWSDLKEE